MLKKAGIIVAASAAALLAVSPLAFAGDKGDDHGHGGHGGKGVQVNSVSDGSHSSGLIALGDVSALNNINICPELPLGLGLGNVLGLLGSGVATASPSADDLTCVAGDSIGQGNKD